MSYNLRKRTRAQKLSDSEDEDLEYKAKVQQLYSKQTEEESSSSSSEEDENDSFIDDSEDAITSFIENVANELDEYNVPKNVVASIIMKNMFNVGEMFMTNQQERWDKHLSDDDSKRLNAKFNEIQEKLKKETPTIAKILDAPMTQKEQIHCLQLFDMWKSTEEGSSEFYDLYRKLCDRLEKAYEKTDKEVSDLEKEEMRLGELISIKETLKEKVLKLDAPDSIKTTIYEKWLKLENLGPSDSEYSSRKNWIEWAVDMPYRKTVQVDKPITDVYENMNKYLYGMNSIKEQLMLLYNDVSTSDKIQKAVALCGPPGTGKTSIAEAFAKSVGLPFEAIALGGSKDSTFLYGSDGVWKDSGPGIIARLLRKMNCNNGVILFDEIDKLDTQEGREIQYALLHITDFAQNKHFRDKYLADITLDLSNIWFFYSMNDDQIMDKALRDRLPIFKIKHYTMQDKIEIMKNYILPKELMIVGMNDTDVVLTHEACRSIGSLVTDDEGARGLTKIVKNLVSRINFFRNGNQMKLSFHIENFQLPLEVTPDMVYSILQTKKEEPVWSSIYI